MPALLLRGQVNVMQGGNMMNKEKQLLKKTDKKSIKTFKDRIAKIKKYPLKGSLLNQPKEYNWKSVD